MSTIEEAPQDRQPVQTYVMEHDWGILVQAISKELRRGGQVFYLHNRVDTIDRCAATIQQFLPDATVVVAHGKMSEEQLSKVWKRLLDHEIDILVCTTIIETGVDVSNCNTLIIEDADRLGLSQLYQIRGRVGRSSRRAFAYLTVTKGKALTDVATKRLEAIREFTTFGSGFRIAMRDLEIRGAGNILGAQQHGHMEAVGYEMYLKMLSEAVAVAKGEKPEVQNTECLVDIRIGAHIPEDYIESLPQRIDIYKKIASVENEKDASDIIDELIPPLWHTTRGSQRTGGWFSAAQHGGRTWHPGNLPAHRQPAVLPGDGGYAGGKPSGSRLKGQGDAQRRCKALPCCEGGKGRKTGGHHATGTDHDGRGSSACKVRVKAVYDKFGRGVFSPF